MNYTESQSNHDNLEEMSIGEVLKGINAEDHHVAPAVAKVIPEIEKLVEAILPNMRRGGRLFYIGAGTSGRLGIVDASECPPTYGVAHGVVVGLMAGGDEAIRKSVEFAEDNFEQAWKDLNGHDLNPIDSVIGIAASGRTPYVIGGVTKAREFGCVTGCITCNSNSDLGRAVQLPIEVLVGPEFVTGSTRMKSGTAQKLVLNMISTTLMIQLGHVKGNRMVDMQLSNNKLVDRGVRMIMDDLKVGQEKAADLLKSHGSVRKAIDWFKDA